MKNLITISFVLHVVSLFVVAAMVALQVPLGNLLLFRNDEVPFVFPQRINLATMFAIFATHCTLTINFWKAMSSENSRLNVLSWLSFIFVIVVQPMLMYLLNSLEFRFVGMWGINYMTAHLQLRQLMQHGLAIRWVSLMIFLIAAARAYQYDLMRQKKTT